jgi:hypothetical protein
MSVLVAGRRIFVHTKGTQTVKICTPRNLQKEYEKYYRIVSQYALPQAQMEATVARFASIAELERWLLTDRKASREPQNEVGAKVGSPLALPPGPELDEDSNTDIEQPEPEAMSSAVAEVLDLLSSGRYSPDDDPWLPEARVLVEQAIDRLIEEFIAFPYLHRVEHSLHARLFQLMTSFQLLAQHVPIGADLGLTQLVHKEWPETVGRDGNRRGNFDLAVLSPRLINGCPSVKVFREGHLQAPIVIELGLDYNAEHLARDAKKLINSKPKHGYLVHLVREAPREAPAEQIILGIESKFGIKTAYAWTAGRQTVVKRVNDNSISEGPALRAGT